ncbi:NAD(P)/FAD-dependent oxidoreductase [Gordonia polyisoprenivorans]|uniref:NAD(P)/FAD-dependent oxidoreductase n=1 Tax=Gordonia polyisoprenivorans TaxID=84595 RepID=UPI00037D339B|nr:NAD(P)/FAD-dependent oxidoreductase [Gordonia polyisoprenivorans]
MTERIDCAVIGAGVVGLAVARRLALAGRNMVVFEAEDSIGTQTSSRNSEVIHAGIYYPTGTRKARLCVAGRDALYRYCRDRGVAHERLGKLIVATTADQEPALQRIAAQAHANGVTDLRRVDGSELADLEPALHASAGLLSPSTGIIDVHGLMRALRIDAEQAGTVVVVRSPVLAGSVGADGSLSLDIDGSGDVRCHAVVNCAGLRAWDVAASLTGFAQEFLPAKYLAKGNYYSLAHGSVPFGRLIYPVPVDGGLGVHLTLDLGGRARFGPDVEWVDEVDYRVDGTRVGEFESAIRRYWPGLPDGALQPDYCGIRPKVTGPGHAAGDFVFQTAADHGVPGLINLFGIESPGLTSCLAIADEVATML